MPELADLSLAQLVLDPSLRPAMPPIQGATDAERQEGRQLAAIHAHYLREMRQINAVIDRVRAGDDPPEALMSIVLHSDMAKNLEATGAICGHQCQVLSMHHNIEEFHMFPGLEASGNDALRKVVDHLREEHKVVHALIDRLAAAAERLQRAPTKAQFEHVAEVFAALQNAVTSHFGYEETELAEAIGHYLDGV